MYQVIHFLILHPSLTNSQRTNASLLGSKWASERSEWVRRPAAGGGSATPLPSPKSRRNPWFLGFSIDIYSKCHICAQKKRGDKRTGTSPDTCGTDCSCQNRTNLVTNMFMPCRLPCSYLDCGRIICTTAGATIQTTSEIWIRECKRDDVASMGNTTPFGTRG